MFVVNFKETSLDKIFSLGNIGELGVDLRENIFKRSWEKSHVFSVKARHEAVIRNFTLNRVSLTSAGLTIGEDTAIIAYKVIESLRGLPFIQKSATGAPI